MENLQEKDKKRKSLKECGFTKAGPCKWVLAWKRTSNDHNLYRFEAARGLWDCESEIEEPENQEIKNRSFFSCCCFDSQSAKRLREEET